MYSKEQENNGNVNATLANYTQLHDASTHEWERFGFRLYQPYVLKIARKQWQHQCYINKLYASAL